MKNLEVKIAKRIEKVLSYTNGWKIDDVLYTGHCKELAKWIVGQIEPQVSLGDSQPVQTADIEKQEQLVTLLYEFADKQLYKEGKKITHKGFKETEDKFRDIYSVGEYLKKIMNLFGYKITPVE